MSVLDQILEERKDGRRARAERALVAVLLSILTAVGAAGTALLILYP